MADEQPGASSTPDPVPTAVDQAVAAKDQTAFRDARRAERTSTTPQTLATDSSSTLPVEQAASTEAKTQAASEPAKKPVKNADTRVQELLRDRWERDQKIAALEARLAPLDAKPAASSTALPSDLRDYPAYQATHPEASYEDYLDARSEFKDAERDRTRQETARAAQQRDETKARLDTAKDRIGKEVERDPAFWDSISERVQQLQPLSALSADERKAAKAEHVIAERMVNSPHTPQLMRYFSDHPEDFARLEALAPDELFVEMGKLEAAFDRVAKPPTNPITSAPKPPTTLGRKSADPSDPIEAAVATGDVAAFKAARQRQRLAALR